jgi:hydrogenase maturation protease
VVIGYGNVLRRDDGAGWRVAEVVAQHWGERVTVLMGQQPLPEWAAVLADADVAFIVDASVGEPGHHFQMRRLLPAPSGRQQSSPHQFSAADLLQLSVTVYGSAPVTYVLPLPAEALEFGDTLSARTARAVEQTIRRLDRRLMRMNLGHPHRHSSA